MLVPYVGTISIPKECNVPGHERFKGYMWHSARWNHTVSLKGERVAVIGNGCSAAQLVTRIFDPGYLQSLQSPNIQLTAEPILEITETGLRTSKQSIDVDVIILSAGFKIQDFLSPIIVKGVGGISLNEQWKDWRGAQAYIGDVRHQLPQLRYRVRRGVPRPSPRTNLLQIPITGKLLD
ncbi:uncharacterized protein A1O5_11816 [Cladophialophora psammophila CBS 110553]|uniref:Uncharacterized protein n=1 Tax=Cladophialophora psammophila CBS 110553 TaxID=1182543 RepID=W9W936_9EURO|nr:uncharacterized protein A1O5_11816 [Cladophialophora psammophila CBS 110553]EXJ61500.1 hypothetical protein A1O5_11816 [Cladophialophora psammophila CBS 110553]